MTSYLFLCVCYAVVFWVVVCLDIKGRCGSKFMKNLFTYVLVSVNIGKIVKFTTVLARYAFPHLAQSVAGASLERLCSFMGVLGAFLWR